MSTSPISSINTDHFNLEKNQPTFRVEVLDYIPLVSIVSGAARSFFGLLQTVAATGQQTISLIDFCLHPFQGTSIDDGTSLYLEGKANMIRGSVAMFPILGNITLYLYDYSSLPKDWERRMAGIVAVVPFI